MLRTLPWLYVGFRTSRTGRDGEGEMEGPLDTSELAHVLYLNRGGTWNHLPLAPWLGPSQLKSPSGFNWGYSGSGPTELARHLLWHATGRRALVDRPDLYQDFKREVVAGLGERWVLPGERIRRWVKEHDQGNPDDGDDGDGRDAATNGRRGAGDLVGLERG